MKFYKSNTHSLYVLLSIIELGIARNESVNPWGNNVSKERFSHLSQQTYKFD